ncbi:MAG: XTP/dITP diphosphatase [Candidatus Abyssubacteria bacterium]
MKCLLATANSGKVREIANILKDLPLDIVSLKDISTFTPVKETGNSFVANARLKAKAYYRQTGLLTLAEDSGLQVDYLNGRPGVFSARFAGENASDRDNVRKLLRELRGVKTEKRTARFVCVIVITDGKKVWIATGQCEGRIATRPSGKSGFGYDPVFIPKGYNTTFAQLGTGIKNEISHRAQALKKAHRILERILQRHESILARSEIT